MRARRSSLTARTCWPSAMVSFLGVLVFSGVFGWRAAARGGGGSFCRLGSPGRLSSFVTLVVRVCFARAHMLLVLSLTLAQTLSPLSPSTRPPPPTTPTTPTPSTPPPNRRRHLAQEEAAAEAGRGQEAHEADRARRGAAGGVHGHPVGRRRRRRLGLKREERERERSRLCL